MSEKKTITDQMNQPEGAQVSPSTKTYSNYPPESSGIDTVNGVERPTWSQNLRYYFAQYCAASSMHGVQYLGERGRFISEKITWSIILIGVWWFCLLLIVKAYNKWLISPVIVTFATTETPISKIPFPAVTICPEVKSDPEIFNYTDVLLKKIHFTNIDETNLTDHQNRLFESFSMICTGFDKLMMQYGYLDQGKRRLGDHVIDDLRETSPKIHKLSNVIWLGQEYNNSYEYLAETISSSGLCYSFNMFDYSEILKDSQEYRNFHSLNDSKPRNWSLKNDYADSDASDTFPRRAFVSGVNGGFQAVLLTNRSHLDHFCGDSIQGFKVTLHHPSELPNMDQHFHVPLDQTVLVAIKPRMITASETIRSYNPKERKCYLPDERNLRFFKIYTQQNCLDECLANYTLSTCACVAFYMPKLSTSPICGRGKRKCLDGSKVKYISNPEIDCSCFPSCKSLEYDIEISQTDWNWRKLFYVVNGISDRYNQPPFDFEMIHATKLVVYYKEMQFLSSERNELYGYVDFFASTGGLLGLFIGVSVTSIIEIIYFLTLRLACNIRRFGRCYWSGETVLIKAKLNN